MSWTAARQPRGRHERLILGVAGIVTVLIVWDLVVRLGLINPVLLGTPTAVFQAGVREVQAGRLWPYAAVSLTEFGVGFVCAILVGVVVGVAAGWYRRLNQIAEPWIAALYATPHVALVPLIILWLGIGLVSKAFVVFLFAVFPIIVNTLGGVKRAESSYLQVAKAFNASSWRIFRTVVMPGSVPFMLTGIRLGAGRALVGMVVAELIAANAGIGFLVSLAGSTLNTPLLLFAIVLIGTFGVAVSEVMRRVEKRFERWRPGNA